MMNEPDPLRVLVVDADAGSRARLTQTLRSAGHDVTDMAEGPASLAALRREVYDLVIADADLPELGGVEFLRALEGLGLDVPVIMVTPADSALTGVETLKAGAMDYVTRPPEAEDLLLRIARAMERHCLLDERSRHKQEVEARLAQSSNDTRRMLLGAVESLASALEARDPNTRGHSARVADLAVAMALALGLPERQRERLRVAGQLHDIGKIGIPDDVLKKSGRLTRSERAQIQMHPLIAVRILSPVLADSETVAIIQHHHERVDGSGYPDGLEGEEVPLGARVLAAADTFDAMTSRRPYRAPFSREQALDEMRGCAGTQLDTDVVQTFHTLLHRRENGKGRDKNQSATSDAQPKPRAEGSDR